MGNIVYQKSEYSCKHQNEKVPIFFHTGKQIRNADQYGKTVKWTQIGKGIQFEEVGKSCFWLVKSEGNINNRV